jgi:DNA-binding response OmpR family regulator
MNQQVLLVEDDGNILSSLSTYLISEGYIVTKADTIAAARTGLSSKIEIVILDWMLPDGQGLDFLRQLRNQGFTMPVIMLTAKGDLVDKVLGLESGADDYLVKPFEPRELLTRMRVRLRSPIMTMSPQGSASDVLSFGGIELSPQSRKASYLLRPLTLTKLEFDLLMLMVQIPGRVFTREEILNKVWGFENFPTTRTVDNHIVQLRQKIDPSMFETVRGIGYRLLKAAET